MHKLQQLAQAHTGTSPANSMCAHAGLSCATTVSTTRQTWLQAAASSAAYLLALRVMSMSRKKYTPRNRGPIAEHTAVATTMPVGVLLMMFVAK